MFPAFPAAATITEPLFQAYCTACCNAVPPFGAPKLKLITFAPESAASLIPWATASRVPLP